MGEAAGVAAGGSPGVTVLVAPPPPRGCRWGFSKAPPEGHGQICPQGATESPPPEEWILEQLPSLSGCQEEGIPELEMDVNENSWVWRVMRPSHQGQGAAGWLFQAHWGLCLWPAGKNLGHAEAHQGKRQPLPPVSATAILWAGGCEQDSLCLWPRGLVPDIKNKGNRFLIGVAWFYAHPQSWREGEVSDIDRGGGKAVTQR